MKLTTLYFLQTVKGVLQNNIKFGRACREFQNIIIFKKSLCYGQEQNPVLRNQENLTGLQSSFMNLIYCSAYTSTL